MKLSRIAVLMALPIVLWAVLVDNTLAAEAPSVTITNKTGNTPWSCGIVQGENYVALSPHQQQHTAEAACINRGFKDGLAYQARGTYILEIKVTSPSGTTPPSPPPAPPPAAVNCAGIWGDPVATMTGPIGADGKQTVEYTKTFKVTVQPANGGSACPEPLVEKWTEVVQHPVPPGPQPGAFIPAAPSGVNFTTLRVSAASEQGHAGDGTGQFRNPCGYSHMALDDPIVFPGQPGASHLHTFFGNTSTNAASTTQSIAAGGSTCAGGIANRSAYWVPAMIDTATNRALVPVFNLIYYKGGYNANPRASIQSPPNGLRLIAGNSPSNTGQVGEPWHYFECSDRGYSSRSQSIMACPPGQRILSVIEYPNCWDGVNLDSPDHRSHMRHSGGDRCPSSHPVALPVVSLNVEYEVKAGQDTTKWRLSSDAYANGPGGYSMHGDVWFQWDAGIRDAWLNNCVRRGWDCAGYLLGDGRQLY